MHKTRLTLVAVQDMMDLTMEYQGMILITGASSGVGRACARLLAGNGYVVLACVRRETDGEKLAAEFPGQVHAVTVDLQQQSTIEAAAETVAGIVGENGLQGMVNCAGTIFSGPLEYFPREQWFVQYDVNLFGTMALISAMLPFIRAGNGRIVNIGAVGGGMALPFFGAIASAKIAFAAASDCLRRELHPWGIHVIIIEPGGIDTPANDKMRASARQFLAARNGLARSRYGGPMETFTDWAYRMHVRNLKPEQVAAKVLQALRSKHPRTRYRIGLDSWAAALASRFLPDRILDRIILRIASLPGRFGALANRHKS